MARWLAGQAAEQLGDYDRAIREYGEALRNDRANRDAALSMLRLLQAQGLDREALPTLGRYRQESPHDAEMLVQTIRFAHRANAPEVVEGAVQTLQGLPGQQARVAAEIAAIRADQLGPWAGAIALREAELDLHQPRNGPALEQLTELLIESGLVNEAVGITQSAVAAHPDSALFQELYGHALLARGDSHAARAALERSLALESERATALAKLAALTGQGGDVEAALALYDRAARADPDESGYAWEALELARRSGDEAEFERRLEQCVRQHGIHAEAANLLALRLREREPGRALALAHRAVRFGGGPDALDTLGQLQLERGEPEAAVLTLTRSLELRPAAPSTLYWLARALVGVGDAEAARRALREALAVDAFPEREAARAELTRLGSESDSESL